MNERIWDYLDQRLSAEEAEKFLAALQTDESLRQNFESCKALNQLLTETEPAEPSLAFVQQVKRKLEARPAAPAPLVSARIKHLFWISVSTLLVFTLGLNYMVPGDLTGMSGKTGWIRGFMDQIMQPQEFLIGISLLSLSLLGLIALDRLLSSQKTRING